MYKGLIESNLIELSKKVEEKIENQIEQINEDCMYNSLKVLKAFHNSNISDIHFNVTTNISMGI